ncbi:hypothetical protein [Microcystis aeruginosa]|nr:hypothetical protein [Microcystis aeruginosa]
MINLEFTEEEKNSLYYERFHHPHPLGLIHSPNLILFFATFNRL